MKSKLRTIRNSRGAAMLALVLALFLFVALAGFFAFDASRAQMAKRELVASCDAAALAGTAMLATYDTSPGGTPLILAQQNAAAYGLNMFQKGSLLGVPLTTSKYVLSPAGLAGVTAGNCNVMVALTNPNTGYQGVSAGDPNGRAISVFAAYGYRPSFLNAAVFGPTPLIGSNYILNASSTGGLPQVDAVMVFDFSGSMDDFTKVTFVMRCFDGAAMKNGTHKNEVRYFMIPSANSTTTLSNYMDWDYSPAGDPAGSPVNVLPPQNLASAGGNGAPPPGPRHAPPLKYEFTMRIAAPFPTQPNDYGSPPGDCTLSQAQGGFCNNGKPYIGGYVPDNAAANYWPQLSSQPPQAPNTAQDAPQRPYLFRYDASYNPSSAVPAVQGGNPGAANPFPPPNGNGAWVTFDAVNNTSSFTDLVVNITDPGAWPFNQPAPGGMGGPDTNYLTGTYPGFSYTFTANEPDANLQSGGAFNFQDMATIVEAARGNMDNVANYNASMPCPGHAGQHGWIIGTDGNEIQLPPPKAHYELAYQRLAMLESQPFATAVDGAENGFFFKMNGLADCRFGFVGFSCSQVSAGSGLNTSGLGSYPATNLQTGGSFQNYSWYRSWPGPVPPAAGTQKSWWNDGPTAYAQNQQGVAGGVGTGFRLPRTAMDGNTGGIGVTNLDRVCSHIYAAPPWDSNATSGNAGQIWSSTAAGADGLWNGRPMNDTHTGEALATAVKMFNNAATYTPASRPAARKAIIFFTDGEPTGGIGGLDANNANTQAGAAKAAGIAIFTIGLNVTGNGVLTTDQDTFLGDGSGSGNGLAQKGGNGGKFFPCATGPAVRQAFTNVARRLSQNQQ